MTRASHHSIRLVGTRIAKEHQNKLQRQKQPVSQSHASKPNQDNVLHRDNHLQEWECRATQFDVGTLQLLPFSIALLRRCDNILTKMSNQEIAKLAPADEDGLQRFLHGIEGLQRGDRRARAGSGTQSPSGSPRTPERSTPRISSANQSPRTPNRPTAKTSWASASSPSRPRQLPSRSANSSPRVPVSFPNLSRRIPSRSPSPSSHAPASPSNPPTLTSNHRTTAISSGLSASKPPNPRKQTPSTHSDASTMSSQRRGAPRNGTRGGSDDNVINRPDITDEIRRAMVIIAEGERKAKSLKDKIIALEQRMRKRKDDGLGMEPLIRGTTGC